MSAASEPTRTAIPSAALLFAVIAAFIVLKSARDALFLGVFPAASLPYLLVLNALTSAAVAAAYVRLTASSSASRNIHASLAAFFGCGLLFWLGLDSESRAAILLFYLWVGLFGTLVPVQAWLVASERLTPRQARRTLGFLGAGASLGGSAGGLLAGAFSRAWGATALLPLAAALVLLALAVSLRFGRQASPAGGATESVAPPPPISRRFVILIVTLVAVGSVVSTFVDFQFKAIAQREMTTAAELAALFGAFYASVEVVTLALQVLATPFLLRRLPLSATLPLLPLVLFAGNGLVLAAASLPSALFLRASEQMLRQSLDRSSRELLYLPVAPAARARLKSMVETLGVRVPEAVGAVALVLLVSLGHAPLRLLATLALLLASIWTVSAVLLGREYSQVLKAAILHREIDFSQARDAILGRDFLGLLPDLIHTSSPETLLHLLELMRTSGDPGLGPHVRPLIEHRDPRVRQAALDLLMTQRHDLSKDVERRLSDEDLEVRAEAVHYLCMRCAPGATGLLADFLGHPDARMRIAAFACALNEPDAMREGVYDRLDEEITRALRQDEPGARVEIAHVLGHPAPGPAAQRLHRRLLGDPDPVVRRAALRSLARAHPPGLVPDLLEALADPALRFEARQALRSYGAAALPELREALHDGQAPLERRKGLVRALGETGEAEVAKPLLELTQHTEPALAFGAIKALNRLRKRVSLDALRPELERLLDQQVRSLETERQRAQSFAPRSQGLMQRVLTQRAQWALERVFRVLGLLYDAEGIYDAYQALLGQDTRRRDLAFEFLATTLEAGARSRVLPLLESSKPTTGVRDEKGRAAVLFGYLTEGDALASAAATVELTAEEVVAWRAEIERRLAASGGMFLVEEALRPWYGGPHMPGVTSNSGRLGTVQKIDYLGRVDIFSGLGAQELLVLAERSEEVVFQRGQTIFREGAPAAEIYSIVSGRVELCREAGQIELLGPGESFGTLAALTREPRFFTACALEQARCLKLHRDTFWEILEAYPRVAHGVIEMLVRKVETLTRQAQAAKQSPR